MRNCHRVGFSREPLFLYARVGSNLLAVFSLGLSCISDSWQCGNTSEVIEKFQRSDHKTFTTPPSGPDWLLVIDDASKRYPLPGALKYLNWFASPPLPVYWAKPPWLEGEPAVFAVLTAPKGHAPSFGSGASKKFRKPF